MIIKITNLSDGVHNFQFEKTVEELHLDEPFVKNLSLDCKLDKSQHQIVVNCNLTIFAKLICDRCTKNFVKDYSSEFTLLYLFNQKEIDEDDVNTKYLSSADDKIDLEADVIDFANLSIPMKKLCSDECKGLCLRCGTNLNSNKCNCLDDEINPNWEPLLKLKDKLN